MATFIPKNSTLSIADIEQNIKAIDFKAEYMTNFAPRPPESVDILRSLADVAALDVNRSSFITLFTKAMLSSHRCTFVHPRDYRFMSTSFSPDFNNYQYAAKKIFITVEARKFTEYNLETSYPLGIRCYITGCSVRDFFDLSRELLDMGDDLIYVSEFIKEAAIYISSWNNNEKDFFFDIVYNHTQNKYSPGFEAKEETGKVFLPGGYMIGNTADWFIYSRLKPHLNVMEVSHALSLRGERSSIRLALTRKGTESSLVFSPPETGHLWGSCYVDPKITDLTLNEGQMTEAELALIDMAGLKNELLLDMPYDLSETVYFQNTKRSYK